jgi:hypothetical protein
VDGFVALPEDIDERDSRHLQLAHGREDKTALRWPRAWAQCGLSCCTFAPALRRAVPTKERTPVLRELIAFVQGPNPSHESEATSAADEARARWRCSSSGPLQVQFGAFGMLVRSNRR